MTVERVVQGGQVGDLHRRDAHARGERNPVERRRTEVGQPPTGGSGIVDARTVELDLERATRALRKAS